MKIKQLEKPKLGCVKMKCDDVICKKLTKYPMINDCWSRNSFNVVVGKMGSGKTSLIVNLLKRVFNKCFEYIYVIIPPNSRASLEDDIFEKSIPSNQIYDDLTLDTLEEIDDDIQQNAENGHNSIIIIDDFQHALKNKDIVKKLQSIIVRYRHKRCTIFLLQQNFQALVKPLRELITNIILINGLGKSQLEKVFNEYFEMDEDTFLKIINLCFREEHDWMCLNNKSKKIYRMFDEVIDIPDK